MKRKELLKRLKDEKIPEYYYGFKGGTPNDKIVLSRNGSKWEVYYTERGEISQKQSFETEELACENMYNRIKEMMNYL